MKKTLSFRFDRKGFMVPYYISLGLILLAVVLMNFESGLLSLARGNGFSAFRQSNDSGSLPVSIILMICGSLSIWVTTWVLVDLWLNAIFCGENHVEYQGKLGRLLGIFVLAFLAHFVLSFISMFVLSSASSGFMEMPYVFGFINQLFSLLIQYLIISVAAFRIIKYLATKTSYLGESFSFRGNWGHLFFIYFLTMGIPLLIVFLLTVAVSAMFPNLANISNRGMWLLMTPTYLLTIIIFSLTQGIFFFFLFQWAADLGWKERKIRLNLSPDKDLGFFFVQTFLLFITLGIYGPAYLFKMARYLLPRVTQTHNETGESVPVAFSFEGDIGKGFLYVWGQILLTIVTLGIYAPFAIDKANVWLFERISVETPDLPAGEAEESDTTS